MGQFFFGTPDMTQYRQKKEILFIWLFFFSSNRKHLEADDHGDGERRHEWRHGERMQRQCGVNHDQPIREDLQQDQSDGEGQALAEAEEEAEKKAAGVGGGLYRLVGGRYVI